MALPLVNEDFEFGCADSAGMPVDLSGLSPEVCFAITKSAKDSIKGKALIHSIVITVTATTGSITTSIVDGTNIAFVSAAGSITGNSKKTSGNMQPFCLADSTILPAAAKSYAGDGTIGTLTVVGTNTSTGATVSDVCTIWFKNAGQNVVNAT